MLDISRESLSAVGPGLLFALRRARPRDRGPPGSRWGSPRGGGACKKHQKTSKKNSTNRSKSEENNRKTMENRRESALKTSRSRASAASLRLKVARSSSPGLVSRTARPREACPNRMRSQSHGPCTTSWVGTEPLGAQPRLPGHVQGHAHHVAHLWQAVRPCLVVLLWHQVPQHGLHGQPPAALHHRHARPGQWQHQVVEPPAALVRLPRRHRPCAVHVPHEVPGQRPQGHGAAQAQCHGLVPSQAAHGAQVARPVFGAQ